MAPQVVSPSDYSSELSDPRITLSSCSVLWATEDRVIFPWKKCLLHLSTLGSLLDEALFELDQVCCPSFLLHFGGILYKVLKLFLYFLLLDSPYFSNSDSFLSASHTKAVLVHLLPESLPLQLVDYLPCCPEHLIWLTKFTHPIFLLLICTFGIIVKTSLARLISAKFVFLGGLRF